jgi:uncharacterized protein (TIRG00374 family)
MHHGRSPLSNSAKPTRWIATIVSILVSAGLLFTLYRSLDIGLVVQALLHSDKVWLVISVGMIVPITYLRAIRFYYVAPRGALPNTREAFRLTLVASALNVFLPAKAGDLAKGYFLARGSDTPPAVALATVVYERLCDVFALITWCVIGWIVADPVVSGVPQALWPALAVLAAFCFVLCFFERPGRAVPVLARKLLPHQRLRKLHDLAEGWPGLQRTLGGRRRWIVGYSLILWLTHLIQIWMFTFALSAPLSFTIVTSLSAVALMAGQIPFTIAGLGARDVLLVVLLGRYMTRESAAAMGVLISTRGLLPPLMGLGFLRGYLASAVEDAQRWRQKTEAAAYRSRAPS